MTKNSVVVFIPGLLGSCLEYHGQPVWDECLHENYVRLARSASTLSFSPLNLADASRIIKSVHLKEWLPFGHVDLYASILNLLEQRFSSPRRVVEFPYDWRADLTHTAARLGEFLSQTLNANVKDSGTCQLTFVTHSMGGLVGRVALVDKHIHHGNVDQFIQIAPPLLGSAGAFSNLYGPIDLPLINRYIWWAWRGWKNGRRALDNLREAVQTFPSIYQLLPFLEDQFLQRSNGQEFNPLAHGNDIIDERFRLAALALQDKISQSKRLFVELGLEAYTIYGSNGIFSTDKSFRVRTVEGQYELLAPIPLVQQDGDDKVTIRSALYDGNDGAQHRRIMATHHMTMCDSETVLSVLSTILR
jgi:pimeloyl-ACP methyl ester carboxylesterase